MRGSDSETESEKSVEASSGGDEAKDEGGEGKKKKPRSGFRDRKVINKNINVQPSPVFNSSPELCCESPTNQYPICKRQYILTEYFAETEEMSHKQEKMCHL